MWRIGGLEIIALDSFEENDRIPAKHTNHKQKYNNKYVIDRLQQKLKLQELMCLGVQRGFKSKYTKLGKKAKQRLRRTAATIKCRGADSTKLPK